MRLVQELEQHLSRARDGDCNECCRELFAKVKVEGEPHGENNQEHYRLQKLHGEAARVAMAGVGYGEGAGVRDAVAAAGDVAADLGEAVHERGRDDPRGYRRTRVVVVDECGDEDAEHEAEGSSRPDETDSADVVRDVERHQERDCDYHDECKKRRVENRLA